MGTIGSTVDRTVSKLEDQLKLWHAKLAVLGAKADVVGQEAKIDSRKRLDEVKAKLAAAQAKLDEVKAAGADKWDTFKHGLESSWKELESTFNTLTH